MAAASIEDVAEPRVVAGADPSRIHTGQELVRALEYARCAAARGSGRARVSLEEIARRSDLPRSTVHTYVSGRRLPTPDALDRIVSALGVRGPALGLWAEALERVAGAHARCAAGRPHDQDLIPRQLPARPTAFVGRSVELAELDGFDAARVDLDSPKVWVVTGPGGVGKTALTLRWAHSCVDRFPDGQLWIDLHGFSATSPLAVADALERLLGAMGRAASELPGDAQGRAAVFRSVLAGKRMLLVLDNARDAAQVRDLLPGTAGVLTIITSRDRLQSLVVNGAGRAELGPLDVDSATTLISRSLPGGQCRATLRRIAERCDGLPLALRIMRERLLTAGADELGRIAEQVDRDIGSRRLDLFELPDPAGDVSLRTALRRSHDALPPRAARAFSALGVCRAREVHLRCVAAVLESDLRSARAELDVLAAANLLTRVGPDRYRIASLVLAFAVELQTARGSRDRCCQLRGIAQHTSPLRFVAPMRHVGSVPIRVSGDSP